MSTLHRKVADKYVKIKDKTAELENLSAQAGFEETDQSKQLREEMLELISQINTEKEELADQI